MMELGELIARIEGLTGPDTTVDVALVSRFYGRREATVHKRYGIDSYRFTESLDAAVALVERALPGWRIVNLCEWDHEVLRARGPWTCDLRPAGTQDDITTFTAKCAHAPTPAIALVLATLKALGRKP